MSIAPELDEEISELRRDCARYRADLAAVTAERDQLRAAFLKLLAIYEEDLELGDPPMERPAWIRNVLDATRKRI